MLSSFSKVSIFVFDSVLRHIVFTQPELNKRFELWTKNDLTIRVFAEFEYVKVL